MRGIELVLLLAASALHAQERSLTVDHIGDSTWEWHAPEELKSWPKYHLIFQEEGSVSGESRHAGPVDSELFAVWAASGPDRIVLRYVECAGDELPPEAEGEIVLTQTATGEIRRLEDSVYQEYAIFLRWGDAPVLVLLSEDFTVRPNLRRKVDGIEVVTMGAVFGMTTQNVRVRAAPSVQAGIIRFPTSDYHPKGSSVRLLARTVQREKVQQWTNYWYYVENTAMEESPRYGWMFGEFLEYSEQEVRDAESAPRPWEAPEEEEPETEAGSQDEEIDPMLLYEYD
jgi:hypothetical protein